MKESLKYLWGNKNKRDKDIEKRLTYLFLGTLSFCVMGFFIVMFVITGYFIYFGLTISIVFIGIILLNLASKCEGEEL